MTWERRPVADEYDEGGRRAVYLDDQVIVVSELAVTILDALPADEETLGRALVARHGPPPGDLGAAVEGALAQLAELRLVHDTSTRR